VVGQIWAAYTIMIRTFVAIELDEEIRKAIAGTQRQVQEQLMKQLRHTASDVRVQWVRPDSIHLTLKFLGDIDEARVEDIRTALLSAVRTQSRLAVDVGGLGVFPDLRAPRVLWVGLSGQVDALMRVAAEVEAALTGVGFPPESRPLSPHLTLARIKERSREVGKGLADSGLMTQPFRVGSLAVHAVCLMKSDLKPSGAVYSRLVEVPLKPSNL
jgi:RNA 2',3'-cyclic 3'-phosphodiesterase